MLNTAMALSFEMTAHLDTIAQTVPFPKLFVATDWSVLPLTWATLKFGFAKMVDYG